MSDIEIAKFRTEFLKIWVTVSLAFIAGEVTLLKTFYKSADHIWMLYGSIFLLVGAIIFWLGAFEAIVNRKAGIPSFENRILSKLASWAPESDKAVWGFTAFSGIFFGVGIVLFAAFLLIASI